MKKPTEEGQMLRIRLECLKLAVQIVPPGMFQRMELVENLANRMQCYVRTGAMQEPEPIKPQYRPVEMTDEGMQ